MHSAPAPAPAAHHAPAPSHPPAPAPAAHHAPPPAAAPANYAPAPQQSSGGGMLAGLGATMAQGFAFGTGSAVARVAVNSVMSSFSGSGSEEKQAPVPAAPAATYAPPEPVYTGPPACEIDFKAFQNCLKDNQGNVSNCDFYYNALQACQSRI